LNNSNLNTRLTCQAVNSNSTPPLSSSVSFDIYGKKTNGETKWEKNNDLDMIVISGMSANA
jgi:hypothetical protein